MGKKLYFVSGDVLLYETPLSIIKSGLKGLKKFNTKSAAMKYQDIKFNTYGGRKN